MPFADSTFDYIQALHVIEHMSDVMAVMEELYRVAAPGGTIFLATPHYTDFSSFCDPTHKVHLTSFSFRYFGPKHGGYDYYSNIQLREVAVRVKLLRLWRLLGFELLVNASPRLRLIWEYYLCYLVRGKLIEFTFQAIK